MSLVVAAAVVGALSACAPPDETPPPPTVDVAPYRLEALAAEPIEDFVPSGVTVAVAPSDHSPEADLDSTRLWSFDAPSDAAAIAAAQAVAAEAEADGWSTTSSGFQVDQAGSWAARASKAGTLGELTLEVVAGTEAWAASIGHEGGAFVIVTTTLEGS